jgi:hypothetical protein
MDKLKQHIQNNLNGLEIDNPASETWDSIRKELTGAGDEEDMLKAHIQQHAIELEIESPGMPAWDKIEKKIADSEPAKRTNIKRIFSYAAAACVLALIGLVIQQYIDKPVEQDHTTGIVKLPAQNENPVSKKESSDATTKIIANVPVSVKSPVVTAARTAVKSSKARKKAEKGRLPAEILQIQADYNNLIASQVNYIQTMAIYGENTGYFEGFVTDFKELDKQEKELRKIIMQEGLQENSITELAMIYQQKLMVLKKLQTEIDKTSNRSKQLTDTIPGYIKL